MTDIIRGKEFDCCECGRHIIQMVGYADTPLLCAACTMMPGWFKIPEVRKILDPDHDGKERGLPE